MGLRLWPQQCSSARHRPRLARRQVFEVLAYTGDVIETYNSIEDDPGALAASANQAVGVAHAGNYVVVAVAPACSIADLARCEMTGDHGDASLRPGGSSVDTSHSPRKAAHLRLLSTRCSKRGTRRTCTLRARTASGAKGTLSMQAKRAKRTITKKAAGRAPRFTLRVKLTRGTYKLTLRFTGRAGWRSQTLTKTLRVY